MAHLTRGVYAEAIAHLTSTVAGLAAAPLRDRLGYPYIPALCRLSWAFADLGDLLAAQRYAEDAMCIAETSGHAPSLAEASVALGLLHLARGHAAEAIPALERAVHLARTWHIAYIRAFSASWLALAYARGGRAAEPAELLDECERDRVWEHVRLHWSRIVVRLGQARLILGNVRRARALAEEGLALARSIGEPAGEADARALLAKLVNES